MIKSVIQILKIVFKIVEFLISKLLNWQYKVHFIQMYEL